MVIEKLQEFLDTASEEESPRSPSYDDGKPTAVSLLEALERAAEGDGEGFPIQRGIGGGDADALLRAVQLKLDINGRFDPKVNLKVKPRGITHRYAYNDEHKSGYIENEVIYDFALNGKIIRQLKYYWTIGVRTGTYEVHHHNDDDENPYPAVPMTFSRPMLDDIKARNLRHKLYARGKGIVVLGVHRDDKLLPLSSRRYRSRKDSCIDWMFKNYPPAHFHELPPVIQRCLGRCEHPALMNTGT